MTRSKNISTSGANSNVMATRIPVIAFFALLLAGQATAQRYVSEKSVIEFYSKAAIEDIQARNEKATALFDPDQRTIAFVVPIDGFRFDKALMQQHFNEKYMESEKYPRSTFQGRVEGFTPKPKGKQNVRAIGKLLIHGVTRDVDIPGEIAVNTDGTISLLSKFVVKLADHNIAIPRLFWQNIAEQVDVTLEFTLKMDMSRP